MVRKRKAPAVQGRPIRQTREQGPRTLFDLEPLGGVSRYQLIRQVLRREIVSRELAVGQSTSASSRWARPGRRGRVPA